MKYVVMAKYPKDRTKTQISKSALSRVVNNFSKGVSLSVLSSILGTKKGSGLGILSGPAVKWGDCAIVFVIFMWYDNKFSAPVKVYKSK